MLHVAQPADQPDIAPSRVNMASKRRKKENIETSADGQLIRGQRVIEGTTKLDQYIIYDNNCIADLHGYKPGQENSVMLAVAKQILGELAGGKSLSMQPLSKYGLE